ncbi:MAG: HNH endonuclease [Myxococcota bacterium]
MGPHYVVIVQRDAEDTTYKDVPFERYHFPKRYLSLLQPPRRFVYYRSEQHAVAGASSRYYFGHGIIERVWRDPDQADHHFASVVGGEEFHTPVPLNTPDGSYYESIDRADIPKRTKSKRKPSGMPPFQSSVRAISRAAFDAIVRTGMGERTAALLASVGLEAVAENGNPLDAVESLNAKYSRAASSSERRRVTREYLDRGSAITSALKSILGATCQICGWRGFEKAGGSHYIEAHHVEYISVGSSDGRCSDNVLLLCPNCHRRIHHGEGVRIQESDGRLVIQFQHETPVVVDRNTVDRLRALANGGLPEAE